MGQLRYNFTSTSDSKIPPMRRVKLAMRNARKTHQPSKGLPGVASILKRQRRTFRWLAAQLSYSPNYLSSLIRGKKPASPHHMDRICELLGVGLYELLPSLGAGEPAGDQNRKECLRKHRTKPTT